MKVVIYGADWCKPCQNTKKLCEDLSLDYEFKDITAEPEALDEAREVLGFDPKSIPQVLVDGKHIGQATEFREHLQSLNLL